MPKHGIYVTQQATAISTPVVATSGIPFFIGTAPVNMAESPVPAGVPALATSWDEAVSQLGYSDDWKTYTLCEAMYSHFKLFQCQPAIFMNVIDTAKNSKPVTLPSLKVQDGQVVVNRIGVIANGVKVTRGSAAVEGDAIDKETISLASGLTASKYNAPDMKICADGSVIGTLGYDDALKGYPVCVQLGSKYLGQTIKVKCTAPTDGDEVTPSGLTFTVVVKEGSTTTTKFEIKANDTLVVTLDFSKASFLPKSQKLVLTADEDYNIGFTDEGYMTINFAPDTAPEYIVVDGRVLDLTDVDVSDVANGVEGIEQCLTKFGIIPDIIAAPGWSDNTEVAALMSAKASAINGMFRGKAIIDLKKDTYTDAIEAKTTDSFNSDEIVCWPCHHIGERIFHESTLLAGRLAATDTDNAGVPYESPSNKTLMTDGLCLEDGTVVNLTKNQADLLVNQGIVTSINFLGSGFVAWGNYTGCYPSNADVKDYFICINRMFDWVTNTLIQTFWSKLDKPMNNRLVDSILDTCNIWLNGLVGMGYLLGARVVMDSAENPVTDLMAGICRFHVYMTPPSPMQECDFILEYDANYVTQAFGG